MWNPKFQIRRNWLNYSSWYIIYIIKMHIYVGFGLCLISKNSIMWSQMKLYYLSMQNIWSAITWNTMIDLHGVALVKTIYNRHAWKDILWLFGTNAQNSIFHAFRIRWLIGIQKWLPPSYLTYNNSDLVAWHYHAWAWYMYL